MSNYIGCIICTFRCEMGYDQFDVAEELDVPWTLVKDWELGRDEPTASQIIALVNLFGCTVEQLLGLEPLSSSGQEAA